jgi:hypothetical protein
METSNPSFAPPGSPRAPLVTGLGFCLAFSVVFSLIAWAVFRGENLPALDMDIARSMEELSIGQTTLHALMIALTHAGGVPAMITLPVLGIFWQVHRRRYWFILPWILIPLGGGLFDLLL